jgi:hypothetical protein
MFSTIKDSLKPTMAIILILLWIGFWFIEPNFTYCAKRLFGKCKKSNGDVISDIDFAKIGPQPDKNNEI